MSVKQIIISSKEISRSGCANAYVREYGKTGDISLFISDFSNNVRKGMLKYRREAEELIEFEQRFTFSGKEIRDQQAWKTEHYMTELAGRQQLKGDRNRGGRDQPFAEHGGRKDF